MALSGKDFTLWNIELSNKVEADEEVYVRIRFEVDNKGRTWIWKRWLLGAYGAIVDMRVSEVREAVGVPQWDGLKDRIVPIDTLNLFVIAPSTLQVAAINPTPRYIRMLEGKAWVPYIGRAPDLFRTGKLIVYYWRHRSEDQDGRKITPESPFRVFMDLNRASVLGNPIVAGTLAFVAVFFGSLLAINAKDIFASTELIWAAIATGITLASVVGIGLVLSIFGDLRRLAQRLFFSFENLIYGSHD